jgi:Ca2+-binding RTX toxin-like protein
MRVPSVTTAGTIPTVVRSSTVNIINGTGRSDIIDGTAAADHIFGYGGNDMIVAFGGGADTVNGGLGDDTIYIGDLDRAFGGEGADRIVGDITTNAVIRARGNEGDDVFAFESFRYSNGDNAQMRVSDFTDGEDLLTMFSPWATTFTQTYEDVDGDGAADDLVINFFDVESLGAENPREIGVEFALMNYSGAPLTSADFIF